MASEKDNFFYSGPKFFEPFDWNNERHRVSAAASLVNGVYVSEEDYQNNRGPNEALARPWWDFFHFRLVQYLMEDNSIFGAVYEFKHPSSTSHYSIHKAPRCVIAFRGTRLKLGSLQTDIRADIRIFKNEITVTSRFQRAVQTVHNMVTKFGALNIWLAGHSLGSAMAMLIGKNLAKSGVNLKAFLFNPPFSFNPFVSSNDENLKHFLRVKSFITAGLTLFLKDNDKISASHDDFLAVSSWIPYLFVNPVDPFSSGYIGYFKRRKLMEKIGARKFEELATQNSLSNLMFGNTETEPFQVLPSAQLTINSSSSASCGMLSAHGLCQWWSKDVILHGIEYRYK
ncbi:GDSL esterase/lipase At4g10955-like isoform X2 [Macadamia integrifolia]|uniref:GDSL esterase/lipase At4g10955-like isoform X2 n=1 Tax=Macadamia integrifolia TaxID=60698 RepID=UPI001C528D82|nr:GDSL esterase/lipase At4g10955-like isoform X2 [Macadamia integrifolia]XP_042480264.1 GDSL esterase/lipase At4g10955-like isoform X2 [Macadamia integrifolia]XP_042480265.1 GDSL esterase/lipase At4g10955-like isoform X2 [Macadamia integrifolia]XP_042480266.1 GDSL esterase/lipase At4g10955-like isoform X2 [Macadamia integrifolia]